MKAAGLSAPLLKSRSHTAYKGCRGSGFTRNRLKIIKSYLKCPVTPALKYNSPVRPEFGISLDPEVYGSGKNFTAVVVGVVSGKLRTSGCTEFHDQYAPM